MKDERGSSEWRGARSDTWRAQYAGMEAMLAPVLDPLIEDLRLTAPFRIVEVGCGAGGTAFELLRRAPAGSTVHGFDIAPALIELARSRQSAADTAVTFSVADMGTTPPAQRCERMISRFGVMFFDDPRTAFARLTRWLEPGARFAFAVWGPPAENPWMTTVRDVVAEQVPVPPPEPDAPGPFRYGNPGPLLALLKDAGLTHLAVRDWSGPLSIGGGLPAVEAATFALLAFSSFRTLLVEAGDDAEARARRALTERFARHELDGTVRLGAKVRIVSGIHP